MENTQIDGSKKSEDGFQGAIDFLSDAAEFLDALEVLQQHNSHLKNLVAPRGFLCVHAIELSLKAFIKFVSPGEKVKKTHNLVGLWDEVKLHDLFITKKLPDEIIGNLDVGLTALNSYQNSVMARYPCEENAIFLVKEQAFPVAESLFYLVGWMIGDKIGKSPSIKGSINFSEYVFDEKARRMNASFIKN